MLAPRPNVRIRFAVELEGDLAPTEFVMVTGSHKLLGQWDPQQAMLLTQDGEKSWETLEIIILFFFCSKKNAFKMSILSNSLTWSFIKFQENWILWFNSEMCVCRTRWRGFIDINDDMLKFRYFVAYKLASADGEERLIICEFIPENSIFNLWWFLEVHPALKMKYWW